MWNEPNNWSTGTVPGHGDDVYINMDGSYVVALKTDVTVANIFIGGERGSQELILHGVDINGNVINNGTIIAEGTSAINGLFTNNTDSSLVVGANSNSTLTMANGFTNYGTIDLTTTLSAYTTTLRVNNGKLVNLGTIRSLPGTNGSRYLYAGLDNRILSQGTSRKA